MDDMTDELPGILGEFAAAAGAGAALTLAQEYGGTEIYVPRRLKPGHQLGKTLGRPAAETLCALYGGGALEVPLGPVNHQARIARSIARMLLDRKSVRHIARAIGHHVRTVWRHKARANSEDPDQPRLF